MDSDKIKISSTTDGKPPREGFEDAPAPAPINPKSGQHEAYWVLSEEERAKGFVAPVRDSYKHVGIPGPVNPLRELTEEEVERYSKFGYAKFEEYPNPDSAVIGRYWTQKQLDEIGKGCGTVTKMGCAIAETYARNPRYYGSTFCCHCGTHLPVGEIGQFVWMDGDRETNERVGT